MDTAAHLASASPRQRRIVVLLTVIALSSGCSYFQRTSTEALSAGTQARVADNLQQNPPAAAATSHPEWMPYQPLGDEQKLLLERLVIPKLYGTEPPAKVVAGAAMVEAPTKPPLSSEITLADPPSPPPPRTDNAAWTPYRTLSAEEKAFLENAVLPQLDFGTTATTANRRPANPQNRAASRSPAPVTAPTATAVAPPAEVSEQPDEGQAALTDPLETTPTPAPEPATAPGPRRDKLETPEETLPGPRVENLESVTPPPEPQPLLPIPEPAPGTPGAILPANPQPAAPPSTGEAEPEETPEARFPRAGEAVAVASNPLVAPGMEASGEPVILQNDGDTETATTEN